MTQFRGIQSALRPHLLAEFLARRWPHSACSRLIRNISKIQSQLKNDMSRTKRFRISGESRSQSAGIESGA